MREREIQLLVVAMETKKSLGPLIGDGSFDAPTTRYGIVDPQTTAAPFVFLCFRFLLNAPLSPKPETISLWSELEKNVNIGRRGVLEKKRESERGRRGRVRSKQHGR